MCCKHTTKLESLSLKHHAEKEALDYHVKSVSEELDKVRDEINEEELSFIEQDFKSFKEIQNLKALLAQKEVYLGQLVQENT